MKLVEPKISFLPCREGCEIEISDGLSSTTFVKVTLTQEQFCQMMSRLAYCDCAVEVFGLEQVGKKMEHKPFEFQIMNFASTPPKDYLEASCKEAMIDAGLSDWISDNYYGSKNSFFNKDGKSFARTTIRRWT